MVRRSRASMRSVGHRRQRCGSACRTPCLRHDPRTGPNPVGARSAGPGGPRRLWQKRPSCRLGAGSGPCVRCRVCPSRPRRRTPRPLHRDSWPCRPERTSSPPGTSYGPVLFRRRAQPDGRSGGRSGCPADVSHPRRATSRAARCPDDGWGPFHAVARTNVISSTWFDLPFHGQWGTPVTRAQDGEIIPPCYLLSIFLLSWFGSRG